MCKAQHWTVLETSVPDNKMCPQIYVSNSSVLFSSSVLEPLPKDITTALQSHNDDTAGRQRLFLCKMFPLWAFPSPIAHPPLLHQPCLMFFVIPRKF